MADLLKRLQAVLGDRYSISREIGRGGMAAVFLADDRKHAREVAVKVLHPELAAAIGGDRFLREINFAAHLRHPHIVPLLDSGEADGLYYYVMPYVEGESLRHRLATQGRLDIGEAIRYWRDVVDAVAYAHRQEILHRDIKPENILLAERHASLVDFGIGKAIGHIGGADALTGFGIAIGTPTYMAPEQAMASDNIDHRADIYALGVLGYEMITGRVPFPSRTAAEIAAKMSSPAPDIRQDRREISEEFARLIKRCLEPDPDKRWQTAEELLDAVETIVTPATGAAATLWNRATPRRRNVAIAAVVLMVAAVTALTWVSMSRARERRWAKETGIPEIKRLADLAITDSAFEIARRVRAVSGSDSEIDSLWKRISRTADLHTTPEGARVYWTAYRGDTSSWHFLGITPLGAEVPQPRPFVALLLKFEKPGYRTVVRPMGVELLAKTPAVLDTAIPGNANAIRIRGQIIAIPNLTRASGDSVRLPDFFLDRFEVTNKQFKQFVAAGGYTQQDFWEYPISTAGRKLSWDSAMARFVDKTGRPGPASWEAGDIPAGRENYPVSGISWYEAAAYAKFAGKSLPTIYHWRRAAISNANTWILPQSNIERSSIARVGVFKAITPYGVHDMAGNVREWCVNADGEMRYILGGGWNENAYIFNDVIRADPLDRSEINGVRLMQRIGVSATGRAADEADPLARPAARGFRDYTVEKPVSDSEFRSFLPIFDYDHTPLNSVVEKSDSTDSRWIRQTISYDAAYGQERMRAYLFLPRNARPPYQTVVFFPGASVVDLRSSTTQLLGGPLYVATNGRAVLYPIYKDTYERGGVESTPMATDPLYNMTGGLLGPNTYRDHVIMYVKDLRRSVDYLTTRADIDTAKLGYIGYSWGGRLGPINLTVDRRFKAAVFQIPGLNFAPRRKEVDEFNYLPYLRIPTLVLSGRYDDVFPLQTSAIPFFQHLGVPAEHKRHRVYPTQHFLPRDEMIRETLDWFDRYLGKVGSRR